MKEIRKRENGESTKKEIVMFNLMKTSHAVWVTDFSVEKKKKKMLRERKKMASHNDYLFFSLFVSLRKSECVDII